MDNEWESRFRERMEAQGYTMKSLSLAAGLNESFVRDMLQRGRRPSVEKFSKLVGILGSTVAEIMGEGAPAEGGWFVPLMGFVGAGAEVEPDFEQVPAEGLEQIPVPFHLPGDMIAFEVRGDSMLPQFRDGAVLIVYRDQRRSLESFYGEEAAVRTSDGRRFIKTILRGSQPGRVNLMSWNAQPIENAHLAWVGEIFTVFPAKSLHRVARQGGIQGNLRLKSA
ncbi:MAG: S24 family peptidase [Mesorhizobium sp.]|uniref:LexA family transcriptional regulator n=2 Tax=Mesorhizobium sp. TaxID=1871066 RepID=UPI00120B3518|nr:LexA family transcriptional regulator [Mesorhizobium sp.]TIQ86454.1 MAG: S24 family peptidase [Mesorhizobium sp.]